MKDNRTFKNENEKYQEAQTIRITLRHDTVLSDEDTLNGSSDLNKNGEHSMLRNH